MCNRRILWRCGDVSKERGAIGVGKKRNKDIMMYSRRDFEGKDGRMRRLYLQVTNQCKSERGTKFGAFVSEMRTVRWSDENENKEETEAKMMRWHRETKEAVEQIRGKQQSDKGVGRVTEQ